MFSIYGKPKCLLYAVSEQKLFEKKNNKNNWTSATEPAGTQNISMKGNPTGPAICRVTILSVRRKNEPSAEARLVSSLPIGSPIPALSESRVHEVPRHSHTIPPPTRKLFILTATEAFHCVLGLNGWLCTWERYSWFLLGTVGAREEVSGRSNVRQRSPSSPCLRQPDINKVTKTKEQHQVPRLKIAWHSLRKNSFSS